MISLRRKYVECGLLLGLTVLAQTAHAEVLLFQTATLDPAAIVADNTFVLQGDGTTAGNGVSGGSLMFGANFTVTVPTLITSIGAAFGDTAVTQGSGSIFGAIVAVDPITGLPTQPVESLASITLGKVLFTPTTDGDTKAVLSLALQPGTYGLLFGSGLFGAAGVADLLAGNNPVGSPSIFDNAFAPFAQDPFDPDVRLFVNVNETPLPGALPLFATGLGAFGFLAHRRKHKALAA
jgi:hypothetical protein